MPFERVRVLTLNIWNRQGPWAARRALIRQGLFAESADIVGLQEVLQYKEPGPGPLSQAEELAEGLPYQVAYGPAWTFARDSALLDFGNALLSRFPLLDQRNLSLPNPTHDEDRALLYALCDTPAGPLPCFVTHLAWQLDLTHVRCQQVRFITDRIAEILAALRRGGTDPLPPLLMGDFNAEPDSDEIRYLRGRHALPGPCGEPARGVYFADCFAQCGQGPGATYARTNRYAAREREPDRRIDYIFAGGLDSKLRGEPLSCRLCFTEPEGDVFPSDHQGVVAEIQVAPRQKDPI